MTGTNVLVLVILLLVIVGGFFIFKSPAEAPSTDTVIPDDTSYFITGIFTRDFSQEQQQGLFVELQSQFQSQAVIMESHPALFRVPAEGGFNRDTCYSAKDFLKQLPYVDEVAGCKELLDPPAGGINPGEPVSSENTEL